MQFQALGKPKPKPAWMHTSTFRWSSCGSGERRVCVGAPRSRWSTSRRGAGSVMSFRNVFSGALSIAATAAHQPDHARKPLQPPVASDDLSPPVAAGNCCWAWLASGASIASGGLGSLSCWGFMGFTGVASQFGGWYGANCRPAAQRKETSTWVSFRAGQMYDFWSGSTDFCGDLLRDHRHHRREDYCFVLEGSWVWLASPVYAPDSPLLEAP